MDQSSKESIDVEPIVSPKCYMYIYLVLLKKHHFFHSRYFHGNYLQSPSVRFISIGVSLPSCAVAAVLLKKVAPARAFSVS